MRVHSLSLTHFLTQRDCEYCIKDKAKTGYRIARNLGILLMNRNVLLFFSSTVVMSVQISIRNC